LFPNRKTSVCIYEQPYRRCRSLSLTQLKINVETFADCLSLLEELDYLSKLIINVKDFSSKHVGSYLNMKVSRISIMTLLTLFYFLEWTSYIEILFIDFEWLRRSIWWLYYSITSSNDKSWRIDLISTNHKSWFDLCWWYSITWRYSYLYASIKQIYF
jgi:hypothetical protein